MAQSKIAEGLERVTNNSSKLVATLQVGVNKILWGTNNTQPIQTVKYTPATQAGQTGSLAYTSNTPTASIAENPSRFKSFTQSGVFNILNALNSVDLCNVLTYAYDNINVKKKPRPPQEEWSDAQEAFYGLQDKCGEVVKFIDKYTAYPNTFIGSYFGVGPNAQPPQQAVSQSNAPIEGGTAVQKYNMYYLLQSIQLTFNVSNPSTGSLFSAEDIGLIKQIPGLGNNINFISDFLNQINQYADYTQISNEDLQKLLTKIDKVRAVCVTIQNLDFKSAINIVGNYLGVDIRSQIQQLSKFIDVTKIIPVLKQINNSIRSFIRIGNQVQGILNLGQFIIKLALLFYKVFKFVLIFFRAIPIPQIFNTVGTQVTIQEAANAAKDESDGVVRSLRSVNALLEVVTQFIRYLLTNANELLIRLDTLLVTLRGCQTLQGSDILRELEQTRADLVTFKEQLEAYIIRYDSKTDPNTAEFGAYQIRVEEEQLVEQGIRNKRRRGIAIDQNGRLVTQSDLTFATDQKIIIEEVKQKLVSLGLVNPVLAGIDTVNLGVISDSLTYLDNNDVLDNNLNLTEQELESADNLDENKGLGLQAFVNNLKGGRRLRRRMRKQLAAQQAQLRTQVATEKQAAENSVKPR